MKATDVLRFVFQIFRLHLDSQMRRGLEASLVWTEIQSCIKGGLEALQAPKGRVPEADYIALSQT